LRRDGGTSTGNESFPVAGYENTERIKGVTHTLRLQPLRNTSRCFPELLGEELIRINGANQSGEVWFLRVRGVFKFMLAVDALATRTVQSAYL
jgi:hypothetical protein